LMQLLLENDLYNVNSMWYSWEDALLT
jgi:hypothetical protein